MQTILQDSSNNLNNECSRQLRRTNSQDNRSNTHFAKDTRFLMCQNMAAKWWTVCFGVLGSVLIVLGTVLVLTRQVILDGVVEKLLPLKPGSRVFTVWEDPPVTVYLQLWFFNVTNPSQVLSGAKPRLQQYGPYSYRNIEVKENITWENNDDAIRYTKRLYYVFDPAKSSGLENDTFTLLNLPVMGMGSIIQDYHLPFLVEKLLQVLLKHNRENLFERFTVKDYLWGYQDPFLIKAKKLLKTLGFKKKAAQLLSEYGIFVGQGNGSSQGVWEIGTQIQQRNVVHTWNSNRSLACWSSKFANMINGTDGSLWPPMVKKERSLYIFYPQIFRSVAFDWNHTHNVDGLSLHRYTWSRHVLESADLNPDNQGFCTPTCMPTGLLNLSSCSGGPLSLSIPHFTDADPSVQGGVEGLQPNQEYYSTMDLHILSGAGLSQATKFQINADLKPSHIFSSVDYSQIQPVHLPIVWMNASATVNSPELFSLCQQLNGLDKLIVIGPFVILGVGLLLLVIGIASFIIHAKKLSASATSTSSSSKDDDDVKLLQDQDSTVCDT